MSSIAFGIIREAHVRCNCTEEVRKLLRASEVARNPRILQGDVRAKVDAIVGGCDQRSGREGRKSAKDWRDPILQLTKGLL